MLKWEGSICKWEVEVIALTRLADNRKARKSQAKTDRRSAPVDAF